MKAEKFIAKFNELRNELIKDENNLFTKNTLCDTLSLYGITPKIWYSLRSNGVIEYVSGGRWKGPEMFKFTRIEHPVHIDLLQKVFDDKSKQVRENNKKYRESVKITEDQAVSFLKELGYKIYKPVTSYEEI